MYYRIKNRLDAKFMAMDISSENVASRIFEQVGILDDSYGENRNANDMGGYVLYFPNEETYRKSIDDILSFYHLSKEMYEYEDSIGTDGEKEWHETLFLLSSDDALILIYPQEVQDV